jgi:hypothetical protein
MTELSPAAQAVWDAFSSASTCAEVKLAAALRAAADQMSSHHLKTYLCSLADGLKLKAIAAELETQ